MLIIPAIDIKNGYVVRFTRGRLDKRIYSYNPIKTARLWQRQQAKLLHIIDLDGASTGRPKNLGILKQILSSVDVPIQFGGGVRNMEMIKKLLDWGVYRIVLSTKAQDETFLKRAFKKFKGKIIVSMDVKAGQILIKGWQNTYKGIGILEFVRNLKNMGFNQIIFTDILKDGTLSGPNIKGTKKLLKETGIKIFASGGVSSLDDISKLKTLEKYGLLGVIVGKALYEGRFTLFQALKLA